MSQTIQNKVMGKQTLNCDFDELTEDNIFNKVLKSTMCSLLHHKDVKFERRQAIKHILVFFDGIELTNLSSIQWNSLRLSRKNRVYEMLINICYFIYVSQLPGSVEGPYFMSSFSENNMARLFEKFVLEYYRCHHGYLTPTAAQVKWNLDNQVNQRGLEFLPKMQTDILLHDKSREKTLIIDTKFYSRVLQRHIGTEKLHSDNLYQIFAYVKNKDIGNTGNVAGMLLYADVGTIITPDCAYSIGGNSIYIRTLNLNQDFQNIAQQLDQIVNTYFEQ